MEVASQGFSNCLKQESPHTITWVGPPESRFTFDHVAGETVSQVCLQSLWCYFSSSQFASMSNSKRVLSILLKLISTVLVRFSGDNSKWFLFASLIPVVIKLQEKLFKVAGLPMVENCLAGYNSCMFAYGQVFPCT